MSCLATVPFDVATALKRWFYDESFHLWLWQYLLVTWSIFGLFAISKCLGPSRCPVVTTSSRQAESMDKTAVKSQVAVTWCRNYLMFFVLAACAHKRKVHHCIQWCEFFSYTKNRKKRKPKFLRSRGHAHTVIIGWLVYERWKNGARIYCLPLFLSRFLIIKRY